MANQLNMAQIHSILTLRSRRWSYRRIGRELGVHRETVKRYVELAAQGGNGESLGDLNSADPPHPGIFLKPPKTAHRVGCPTPGHGSAWTANTPRPTSYTANTEHRCLITIVPAVSASNANAISPHPETVGTGAHCGNTGGSSGSVQASTN